MPLLNAEITIHTCHDYETLKMSWSHAEILRSTPEIDWFFTRPTDNVEWQRYLSFYQLDFLTNIDKDISHYAGIWHSDDHRLMVQSWRYPHSKGNPTAVIVHGYYDHVGLYGSLIAFCLNRGYNVIAIDLPGHGLSDGPKAHITSFQIYDQVFSKLLACIGASIESPVHVFAQSMGGAIVINYILKRRLQSGQSPLGHTVLFAPLVRANRWLRVRWMHGLLQRFVTQLKRSPSDSSHDQEFLTFLNTEDPLQATHLSVDWVTALINWNEYILCQPSSSQSVILLQGDEEKTVDASFNIPFIAEKLPHHILLKCKGVRHHMVNEMPELRNHFYQQLDKILDRREHRHTNDRISR